MGRRWGHRSRGHSAGREAALRHIEEARALSAELGGTDHDVKNYFFNLNTAKLSEVLEDYGARYGADKKEYAEETFRKWKAGRVKMSGLVASRLYDLLPPRMPLEAKFDLVKSLWSHVSPTSAYWFLIGPDATTGEIVQKVRSYLEESVVPHTIPAAMKGRFTWLSGGDVSVQEQLLNYLRKLHREAPVEVTELEMETYLSQIKADGHITKHLKKTIKLGNQECNILFDAKYSGVTEQSHAPTAQIVRNISTTTSSDYSWLWWIIGLLALFWLFSK